MEGNPSCPSTHKWLGGQCVSRVDQEQICEIGYILRNGDCVSDRKPDCAAGTIFNGTACVGGVPKCEDGTIFDGNQCAGEEHPECRLGLIFNGRKCVAELDPACGAGTQWNAASKECVGVKSPRCPDGQKFNGEYCALDSGDCMDFEFCPARTDGLKANYVLSN